MSVKGLQKHSQSQGSHSTYRVVPGPGCLRQIGTLGKPGSAEVWRSSYTAASGQHSINKTNLRPRTLRQILRVTWRLKENKLVHVANSPQVVLLKENLTNAIKDSL